MKRRFAIAALAVCAACRSEPSQPQMEALVPHLVARIRQDVGGDLAGIQDVRPPLSRVDVYVDRSLTMKPYLRTPGTALGGLLGAMDDFMDADVSFHGFGFPSPGAARQEIHPLQPQDVYAPETYSYANNDYAALFRTFANDRATRVVVTDGVQSDPGNGARLSAVTGQLHRWVTQGGAFAAFVYRNPYNGQYFSDLEGEDPVYRCDDRPLVVFVLAPSARAIDDLMARLNLALEPVHVVRLGGNDLAIRLRSETPADSAQGRGTRVARDLARTVVQGFKPVTRAVVVDHSGRENDGYVPLQFEAALSLRDHPWASMGRGGTARFLRHLEPRLAAWSVDLEALGRPASGPRDTAAAVRHLRLDAQPGTVGEVRAQGDSLFARFVVPVRRPAGRGHHFALLAELAPTEQGARELVPGSFSVDDDRQPGACGGVLKLRRLLGSIVMGSYAPGRALVVADWR